MFVLSGADGMGRRKMVSVGLHVLLLSCQKLESLL